MCYPKPGPRCSGHTRTKFHETKTALVAATKDVKAKQEAMEAAETDEARANLQASEQVVTEAEQAHTLARENYEKSKAERAVAMEEFRKARDEYYSSPEGIEKNQQKSEDTTLTPKQREEARRFVEEGEATRAQQKQDHAFQKALDTQQKQKAPVRNGGSGSTLGKQLLKGKSRGKRSTSKGATSKPMNLTSGERVDEVVLGLLGEMFGVKS